LIKSSSTKPTPTGKKPEWMKQQKQAIWRKNKQTKKQAIHHHCKRHARGGDGSLQTDQIKVQCVHQSCCCCCTITRLLLLQQQ